MQFFRAEQKARSVTGYFMHLKKITVELALLLPFSPHVKVQQAQREKIAVMIFLNGLLPEFGMAEAQILSDSKRTMLSLMSFALKALQLVCLFLNLVVRSLATTITPEHLKRWIAIFIGIVMIIEKQILQRLFITTVVCQVPQVVACLVVPFPFEVHCRLGHPSLFVLEKLYPEFRSLSSLNCDSCQFAKFHSLSSSPRVNK